MISDAVSEIITLDESKKHGNIQVSEDKTEMSMSPSGALSPNALTSWSKVWASQSFSKGLHYWEVAVGGCESWQVGVMENTPVKGIQTKPVSQEKNSWILEREGGELSVQHNNDFTRVKENNIETLGVFVDCDKGRVKFYNVNTGCVVHSFTTRFKHAVHPVFSIQPQKDNMMRLKICNLIHEDAVQYDSTNASVSSEMPGEPESEVIEELEEAVDGEEDMELSSESSNYDIV